MSDDKKDAIIKQTIDRLVEGYKMSSCDAEKGSCNTEVYNFIEKVCPKREDRVYWCDYYAKERQRIS